MREHPFSARRTTQYLTCQILVNHKKYSQTFGPFGAETATEPSSISTLMRAVPTATEPTVGGTTAATDCIRSCAELHTADAANCARAESSVKRDVGCEERECLRLSIDPEPPGIATSVSSRSNCSCCARCIWSSCSR